MGGLAVSPRLMVERDGRPRKTAGMSAFTYRLKAPTCPPLYPATRLIAGFEHKEDT